MQIVDFILHCDKYIETFILAYGQAVYLILFAVIFCETGLVFLPFLPGDSLLFAAGAFAGTGKLNVWVVLATLIGASMLGDNVNYHIGKHFGRRILEYKKIKLVKDEHLHKANEFVRKHGGKAVILAKYVPIVRTIVPFIVGIGGLDYKRFLRANTIGGILWVSIFVGMGYFFGNIEAVKSNFSIIIMGILFVSLAPIFITYIKATFFKAKKSK